MIDVKVILEGDNAWPDLKEGGWVEGKLEAVARLPGGMTSGKSSVAFRIELPDGQTIIAQTSMTVFQTIARAFQARDDYDAEQTRTH